MKVPKNFFAVCHLSSLSVTVAMAAKQAQDAISKTVSQVEDIIDEQIQETEDKG